jgi:hypothetical protein
VNPEGTPTTYYFEYGLSTAYSLTVPVPSGCAGSGIQPVTVSYDNVSLLPDTLYHYRLVAASDEGTTYGADVEFRTLPDVPKLSVEGVNPILQTGATLHGYILEGGDGTAFTWRFDYGLSTAYGSQTSAVSLSTTLASTPVSAAIAGLQPGTTYHFRLEATNSAGTTYSGDFQFTATGTAPTSPYGYSSVPMYNCSSDGADAYFWAFDQTTGGQWQLVGSQSALYDDAGSCPAAGSSPEVFTPSDHHVYELVAVDPTLAGCSGNDPSDYACIAASVQVEGDSTGPEAPPFEVS